MTASSSPHLTGRGSRLLAGAYALQDSRLLKREPVAMALPVQIKAAMSDLPLPLATDAVQGGINRTGVAIAVKKTVLRFGAVPAWVWFGLCVYAIVLIHGPRFSTTPTPTGISTSGGGSSITSLCRASIPIRSPGRRTWISTSWLAQVPFAASFELAGWAGLIVFQRYRSPQPSRYWPAFSAAASR